MSDIRFKCILMIVILFVISCLGVFAVVVPLDGVQRVGGDRQWSYIDESVSIAGKSYQGWGCVTDGTLTHRMLGTVIFDVTRATRFTAYAGLRDTWIGDDGTVAIEVDGKLTSRIARKSGDPAIFIDIALKSAKRLAIRMAPSILLASPMLYDNRTFLHITTEPSGAEVYIKGERKGVSPLKIELPTAAILNKLTVVVVVDVKKLDYKPITQMLTLWQGQDNTKTFTLLYIPATLEITTLPSGAELYLDGIKCGISPMTVRIPDIPDDGKPVNVEIRKHDYTTISQPITLHQGQNYPNSFKLTYIPATLEITTVPPGAELYLDGTKCGTSPMTIRVPDIPDVGKTVQLEIRIAGCNTVTETVSLVQGQQNALSFELILLSPTLQITTIPSGATVLVDGRKQLGITPMKLTFTNMPGACIKLIECRLQGFSSLTRLIKLIPEGHQLTFDFLRRPINPKDGAEMIFIPAGKFLMGTPFNNGNVSERPAHEVTLSDYWIYKYEVTVAQYLVFCSAMGHDLPKFPSGYSWAGKSSWTDPALQQHPIVNVSWNDAKAYADWAGVCLPTEAQWEYAACGPSGRNYPWGGTATVEDSINGWDQTKYANYYNSGNKSTWPVGSFPNGVSWCGAQDLAGNAWEWCSDWYRVYPSSPVTNPTGPATGDYRVIRGGSWCGSGYSTRSAYRDYYRPGDWHYDGGFRCVSYSPGP